MDIKKTHVTKDIPNLSKPNMQTTQPLTKDSIDISRQAKILTEVNMYKNIILAQVPDVREDKVLEARQRLQSGFYTSNQVLDSLSGKLSTFLSEE